MTLNGKVAIVTGGNSGIGKAITLALAGAGANIVIDYVANEQATEAQYEKVMEINLKSAFFGIHLAAKQMIAQGGGGRIINITSVHEDWPMPGNAPYCLSKGGMRMLTRQAGMELAPTTSRSWGSAPRPSPRRLTPRRWPTRRR